MLFAISSKTTTTDAVARLATWAGIKMASSVTAVRAAALAWRRSTDVNLIDNFDQVNAF